MGTRYRDSIKPSHKALEAYLLIQSWKLGVDCVAIRRNDLLKYLRLERMQAKRTMWIKKDLKDLFPHQKMYYESKRNRYKSLYLSRFEFPEKIMKKKTRINDRTKLLCDSGFKTAVVELPSESKVIKFVEQFFRGITIIEKKP